MRHPARNSLLFTLLLCTASSAFAQNATEFYLGLLRRGTSYAEAGQYDAAATPLRIAAFGLVEMVDKYETALAYLAVTHDRLGNQDAARDSIRRIVAAERVERKFASLPLPAPIRTAFDAVAKKHLSPAEVSALASGAPIAQTPRTQPVTTTRPAPTSAQQAPAQDPTTQAETTPPPQTAKPAAPTTTPAKPESSTAKPESSTTKPAPSTSKPAPATTKPSSTPAAPPKAEVKSEPKKPEPKPAEPKPAPAMTQPQTTPPPAIKAPAPQPSAQTTSTPATTGSAPPAKPLSAKDLAAHMAAAERALAGAQLAEARRLYHEILESPGLDRDSTLRVAEGFYRSRDFAGALAAFKALGALKRGEEPYGYYYAVSLYETGAYEAARKELTAAIPYIEMTPDVLRYRAKIEGAR